MDEEEAGIEETREGCVVSVVAFHRRVMEVGAIVLEEEAGGEEIPKCG